MVVAITGTVTRLVFILSVSTCCSSIGGVASGVASTVGSAAGVGAAFVGLGVGCRTLRREVVRVCGTIAMAANKQRTQIREKRESTTGFSSATAESGGCPGTRTAALTMYGGRITVA